MHGTAIPPWVLAEMERVVNRDPHSWTPRPPSYQTRQSNASTERTTPASTANPGLVAYEQYQADLIAQDLADRKAEAEAQAARRASERWNEQLEAQLALDERLRKRYLPAPSPAPPALGTRREEERRRRDDEDLERLREEARDREARETWETRLGGLQGEIGNLRKIIDGEREERERREEMDAIKAVARAEAEERPRRGSRRSRSRSRSRSASREKRGGRGSQRGGGRYEGGSGSALGVDDVGYLLNSALAASATPRGFFPNASIGSPQAFLPSSTYASPSIQQFLPDRHAELASTLNITSRNLSGKLDSLDLGQRDLGSKFDRVEGLMGSRFDQVEGRLGDVGAKEEERHRDLNGRLERMHLRSEERFLEVGDALRGVSYALGRGSGRF